MENKDHLPLLDAGKTEGEDTTLKRGGELYNTITKHTVVENLQVYKVERNFNDSRVLYLYIAHTDCFVEVPEALLLCPPRERLPLSTLQPTGLVYRIIRQHVTLQHLNAFLLPMFPNRAFVYNAEDDCLCEMEAGQVLNQGLHKKICFCGITILMLSAWPSRNWTALPPCSYCTGACDDPR